MSCIIMRRTLAYQQAARFYLPALYGGACQPLRGLVSSSAPRQWRPRAGAPSGAAGVQAVRWLGVSTPVDATPLPAADLPMTQVLDAHVPQGCSSLRVRNSAGCRVVLQPADPDDPAHSTSIRAFVSHPELGVSVTLARGYQEDCRDLEVQGDDSERDDHVTCLVTLPINCDLAVSCSGVGCVTLRDLQADSISARTDRGDIEARNLRAATSLALSTRGGNISASGLLQAHKITLDTLREGSISCQRLQGSSCVVRSEQGAVRLASCYCDSSVLFSRRGHLALLNMHRQCTARVDHGGSITVSGLDGSLQASVEGDGPLDVQLSKLRGDSQLETDRGPLTLRLADPDTTRLCLEASTIECGPEFSRQAGKMEPSGQGGWRLSNVLPGSEEAVLSARSETGTVRLLKADWLDTALGNR